MINFLFTQEITYKAKFIVEGETRFDLNQGELGSYSRSHKSIVFDVLMHLSWPAF